MSPFRIDLEKFYYQKFADVNPNFRKKIGLWSFNLGVHAVAIYRFGRFFQRQKERSKLLSAPLYVLYRIMRCYLIFFHFIDISDKANIGPGFYIPRAKNILIPQITIGENFTIHHNVTVGTNYEKDKINKPTIGNNVWIGTGSVVTGGIKIGNDVTISACSVVARDIPDGSLVAGNPGRVLFREHDNSKWMRYTVPGFRHKENA